MSKAGAGIVALILPIAVAIGGWPVFLLVIGADDFSALITTGGWSTYVSIAAGTLGTIGSKQARPTVGATVRTGSPKTLLISIKLRHETRPCSTTP